MAAWHRPDRIRRVFTGVGTYVGIHGGDQLPVLIRKYEPKPLRIFLQSGTNDNNLYCGDWWMANQMMERSLTWAGYDVNHAWGTGGHNQKHATQIFPDVLRWLWRDYATAKEIKANPRGDSRWRGYEVMEDGKWSVILEADKVWPKEKSSDIIPHLTSLADGTVFVGMNKGIARISASGSCEALKGSFGVVCDMGVMPDGTALAIGQQSEIPRQEVRTIIKSDGQFKQHKAEWEEEFRGRSPVFRHDGMGLGAIRRVNNGIGKLTLPWAEPKQEKGWTSRYDFRGPIPREITGLAFSPDQTVLYATGGNEPWVCAIQIRPDGEPGPSEHFYQLDGFQFFEHDIYETSWRPRLCVDTNGWLYVATALGIQVCDQAGRVNFIIPTPQQPHDVCFGGKDLGELFIACGDKIYKRPTNAHGYVSGQMAPIKPKTPKL